MTVKNHLARIYQRLGVRNRNEAVIAARSRGLIE
ncbi:MAG: LuxR C-terminal-related transcriptional regulator [Thermomicrobiales bacterium]